MTLDLSAVTDSLIGLVKSQWTAAPIWTEIVGSPAGPTFTPTFTGLAPDAARQEPGPQLSMYLYHVEPDNAREALFWQAQMLDDPAGSPTRFLPLGLNLFYLLFAYSEASYTQEQEAMSVALRIFHDNPIVRSDEGVTPAWELTLTVEHRSYDELSRLWQATTAPLRMSLVYRAAVAFIEPDPVPSPPPNPATVVVATNPVVPPPPPAPGPGSLPGDDGFPVLSGTFRDASYTGPAGHQVLFPQSPATVAAGQTAWLLGSDLPEVGVSYRVYLLPAAGGTEVDVTAWAVPDSSTPAKIMLTLPQAAGTAPAGTPPPGVYQFRAGGAAADAPRTGTVPVSVAAYVDPAGGPVLAGTAPFQVNGAGFIPGATEVLVGTVALASTTAVPAAGEFSVDQSGTFFSFWPPARPDGMPDGMIVPLRVRVNGVESDPALWVKL